MKKSLMVALGALIVASPALAQEEPVVNVYNWSDYIAEDTIAQFEAETGIKVNYDVFDSNEIVEAKLLAGSSGYDVVVPSGFFLERQIEAGLFQPLDKSKLPNLSNLDPGIMATASVHDPDNAHSIVYMQFTVGLGYDVAKVTERVGADGPLNSWDLVFKPEVAAKLADCGIAMLDSPAEVTASALKYLGRDPNSESEEDLAAAEELLMSVRPYVRYFHSSQYIDDLGSGEICIALGYSGDVFIAADAAAEAGTGEITYIIPKEGALSAFDMMAIPSDAPHPDNAHKFINFIMKPEITAGITDYVYYASANAAATEFVSEEVRNNPGIYPPDDVKANAFALKAHSANYDRILTRAWTRIKTGQ